MTKKTLDYELSEVNFLIGLGPGFTAGVNCHAAIETKRGHFMGRVLWEGSPPGHDMYHNEEIEAINFNIQVACTDGDGILSFQDLILFPADEWISEFEVTTNSEYYYLHYNLDGEYDKLLDISSIDLPKRELVTLIKQDTATQNVIAPWKYMSPAPFSLQSNADQRMFFLSELETGLVAPYTKTSPIGTNFRIQLFRNARYYSMRGAR